MTSATIIGRTKHWYDESHMSENSRFMEHVESATNVPKREIMNCIAMKHSPDTEQCLARFWLNFALIITIKNDWWFRYRPTCCNLWTWFDPVPKALLLTFPNHLKFVCSLAIVKFSNCSKQKQGEIGLIIHEKKNRSYVLSVLSAKMLHTEWGIDELGQRTPEMLCKCKIDFNEHIIVGIQWSWVFLRLFSFLNSSVEPYWFTPNYCLAAQGIFCQ